MAAIQILTAGVTPKGIELLNEVSQSVFGGGCSIEELTSDNLKSRIRLAQRDTSVALVILNEEATETCRGLADKLLSSDIFHQYSTDSDLAVFLNQKYGLDLEVEEEEVKPEPQEVEEAVNFADVQRYILQLTEKDSIIKTLNLQIAELRAQIDDGVVEKQTGISEEEYNEVTGKVQNLSVENDSLKDEISKLKEELSNVNTSSGELNSEVLASREKIETLEKKLKDTSLELADERRLTSQQTAVIRDKDDEIEKLQSEAEELSTLSEEKEKAQGRVKELEGLLNTAKRKINSQGVDIKTKDKQIDRLNNDLADKEKIASELAACKDSLTKAESDRDLAETQITEIKGQLSDMTEKATCLDAELSNKLKKIEELQDLVEAKESQLFEANKDKLRLEEKVRVLGETDGDSAVDELTSELSSLRMQMAEMKLNIFNALSSKAQPRGKVKVPVVKGIPDRYKNIRFQFAGNAESKRGTYKCMLSEFREMPNEKFLIVDISPETAIDYVFEMKRVVDGIPWFERGGDINRYISPTLLSNVNVLTPSIGYFNDSYFLTVDWLKRLRELESLDCHVVLFCGDLSNLIGRVLFEAFSEMGSTLVYVKGNALGSRAMLANSSGLMGIKRSLVVYYEFDKAMSRFYDAMKRQCDCKIISYVRGQ